jgi:hypothetical protein
MLMLQALITFAAEAAPDKTPFYIAGGFAAVYAVAIALIGITQPDFPRSQGTRRVVCLVSALVVAAAMTAAVASG